MKIYVAGGYADRDTARRVAGLLVDHGHTITYPWWDRDPESTQAYVAEMEWGGITVADVVVVLAEHAGTGTATEMGIAMASPARILLVEVATSPLRLWFAAALEPSSRLFLSAWLPHLIADAVLEAL